MRSAALAALLVLAGCATPPASPPTPAEASIAAQVQAFHGARAFQLAAAQVARPCAPPAPLECTTPVYRITGTPNNTEVATWIGTTLTGLGWSAGLDSFHATFEDQPLAAHNVLGERRGATNRTLYVAAHYDTRPCADKDPEPARRSEPVLGANDGASGVAVMLAMAELLADRSMNLTLRFLFFDAEDMGDAGLGCGQGTPWAQGSAHYAGQLTDGEVRAARGLVLLDMVGDTDLELRREGASDRPPHKALEDDLYAWAARLGYAQFRNETGPSITDDHVAFQARGMAAVDLIHLDGGSDPFPDTHHTTHDDLGHLSPASLEAVGRTVLAAVLAWDAAEGRRG